MYCVPVNNKQNVALPNKRVMVKPTRKVISDIQRRTACGPAQQTRHGETYTRSDFRPFDDGQHVALPNRRVMVKPTRKLICDVSTTGSMWPCPTDASW